LYIKELMSSIVYTEFEIEDLISEEPLSNQDIKNILSLYLLILIVSPPDS
jgi:hypothetical protein